MKKKVRKKSWFFRFFFMKIDFFQVSIYLKKIDFSIEKIKMFVFFLSFFFKFIFLHDAKIFFDGIFFKAHLEIQENWLEVVSERFRQYKPSNLRGYKKYTKQNYITIFDFWKIFQKNHLFSPKNEISKLFFWNHFSTRKNEIFSMRFFLKFIYEIRRIDWKGF